MNIQNTPRIWNPYSSGIINRELSHKINWLVFSKLPSWNDPRDHESDQTVEIIWKSLTGSYQLNNTKWSSFHFLLLDSYIEDKTVNIFSSSFSKSCPLHCSACCEVGRSSSVSVYPGELSRYHLTFVQPDVASRIKPLVATILAHSRWRSYTDILFFSSEEFSQ